MAPERHVVVQPTVFKLQTRWSAPTLRWTAVPGAHCYLQLKKMTDSIRGSLVAQGYEPRDHFDVARFIWETLRLRGRQRLQELLGNTPQG